jgi:sugar/nucleoside kinase (ribokinase family)
MGDRLLAVRGVLIALLDVFTIRHWGQRCPAIMRNRSWVFHVPCKNTKNTLAISGCKLFNSDTLLELRSAVAGNLDCCEPGVRDQSGIFMKTTNVSNRNGLLAGGNWIIDQVKIIDAYPQAEHLANIFSQSQGTGGAPYNVLLDLAKMGATFPLAAAGLVGKDALGDQIIKHCQEHNVDVKFLKTSPLAATSFTDVMTIKASGRRTFFHLRGANAVWDGKELDFRKTKAKIFHLGYLLLLDKLDEPDLNFGTKAAKLLAAAQAAGLKTSVDVVSEDSHRFKDIVSPALKYTDYCILNEMEAGKTAGFKIRQPDGKLDTVALRHAAGALLQLGVKDLIVIHFPEGAFARTRKGEDIWQSSVKLPPKYIAGTGGAGDAFCAGVLFGLHEGWELQRCLLTGVCVAAMSLAHPTCTGGMKPLAACLALAKKFGIHSPLEPDL